MMIQQQDCKRFVPIVNRVPDKIVFSREQPQKLDELSFGCKIGDIQTIEELTNEIRGGGDALAVLAAKLGIALVVFVILNNLSGASAFQQGAPLPQ